MFTGTETNNLGLPQFTPNDHPDFLTDINDAFRKIDKAIGDCRNKNAELQELINALESRVALLESADRLNGKE